MNAICSKKINENVKSCTLLFCPNKNYSTVWQITRPENTTIILIDRYCYQRWLTTGSAVARDCEGKLLTRAAACLGSCSGCLAIRPTRGRLFGWLRHLLWRSSWGLEKSDVSHTLFTCWTKAPPGQKLPVQRLLGQRLPSQNVPLDKSSLDNTPPHPPHHTPGLKLPRQKLPSQKLPGQKLPP